MPKTYTTYIVGIGNAVRYICVKYKCGKSYRLLYKNVDNSKQYFKRQRLLMLNFKLAFDVSGRYQRLFFKPASGCDLCKPNLLLL